VLDVKLMRNSGYLDEHTKEAINNALLRFRNFTLTFFLRT
jgi:hypothetical protein